MIEVRHSLSSATWSAMDADLLRRVRKTSVILGLVLAAPLASAFGLWAAAGWIAGFVWSLVNLQAIESIVRGALRNEARDRRAIVTALVAKFPLLYLAGFALLAWLRLPPAWLVAGFTWPLFVAVMKSAGRLYMGLDETPRATNSNR